MESCSLLHSDWEKWGLWVNSSHNSDDIFDFSSPLDQSLTSELEDANNDGKSDLFAKWMDEKIDLSVMHLEGQPGLLDDLDVMIEDPTALLENLMDWSPEVLEKELDILNSKFETENGEISESLPESGYVATPDSPGGRVPDNNFAMSPESQQESFYLKPINDKNPSVNHKIEEDIDQLAIHLEREASSPTVPELSANYSNSQLSPSTSVSSTETLDSVDSKDTCVLSCNSPATDISLPIEVSLIYFDSENDTSEEFKEKQEVSCSTRKRSQNRKKLISTSNSAPTGEFRRDRKRKQNKDAATRYRQKKRKEGIAIKSEEFILESRNKELHNKVKQLSNEISYLKGLLKEAKLRMQSSELPKSSLSKVDQRLPPKV